MLQRYADDADQNVKNISFYYGTSDDDEDDITLPASDSVEHFDVLHTIDIVYDGNKASVSTLPSGVQSICNGARVEITSTLPHVRYIVSGSSSDGQLSIQSVEKFRLDLNGVTLCSTDGPAIYSQCSKKMFVVLANGTLNTLTDGAVYTPLAEKKMKGALYTRGNLIISGGGALTVTGQTHNAIATDDYLRVRSGCQLFVNAEGGHGLKANEGIYINGSVVNISVTASGGKGLNSESDIVIDGGHTTVIAEATSLIVEPSDTTHCAGVKSDNHITVNGGILNILCLGDNAKGMKSDGNMTLNGGEVNIVTKGLTLLSKPKALKCENNLYINGGELYAYALHAKPVDADGQMTVQSRYNKMVNTPHLFYIRY